MTYLIDENVKKALPKKANTLSVELRRHIPNLRRYGIAVTFAKGKERLITLERRALAVKELNNQAKPGNQLGEVSSENSSILVSLDNHIGNGKGDDRDDPLVSPSSLNYAK